MTSPIDINQGQVFKRSSTADTNPVSVNAGKCGLSSLVVTNTGGAAAFFKLYDKASAPTVGTDIPVLTIAIPASGTVTLDVSDVVLPFFLGLAYAITNLAPDADTTAVAAGQVKVMGVYLY